MSASSVVELAAEPEHDTATTVLFDAGLLWPDAQETKSTLTCGEAVDLCGKDKYGVPEGYTLLCATDLGWVACETPAEHPNAFCVYANALGAGMRLPLHDFYIKILRHYGIAPSQLDPNAWAYMAAFVLLCEDVDFPPTLHVFRYLFSLCAHTDLSNGRYYFLPCYRRQHIFKPTDGKMPTNLNWKSRFFFLEPPSGTPCQWPVKWGKPRDAALTKPRVISAEARAALKKLKEKRGKHGIDIAALLGDSRHRLPVGVIAPQPPLMGVRAEASAARKRRRVTATGRKNMSSAAVHPQGTLDNMARELQNIVHKEVEEKLAQKEEEELQAAIGLVTQQLREQHAAEVAQLREQHATEVAHLKDDLQAAKAEAARLKEAAKAEVQAVKEEGQSSLMSAEHNHSGVLTDMADRYAKDVRDMADRYGKGVRDMAEMVHILYPDVVVDPEKLTQQVLPGARPGFPPRAPANQ